MGGSGPSIWLGIQYYAELTASSPGFSDRDKDVGFMWDDGTMLDGNLLNLNGIEPYRDQGTTIFIEYYKTILGISENVPCYCVCQSSFGA